MPISASITSGSSALWQQSASQQAQRTADQANQAAQSLQAQARDARSEADRAQDEARTLELKAAQAQATASQASLSVQTSTSFLNMQSSSSDIYTVLPKTVSLDNRIPSGLPTNPAASSASSANLGSVINTTA